MGLQILFWILAGLSVITALTVVIHRNPMRAALALVVNFLSLAVLYILLNAQVLAALQVIVYAGAIMVLVLFVIQLLNLGGENVREDPLGIGQRLAAALLGMLLLGGIMYGINAYAGRAPAGVSPRLQQLQQADIPQIQIIGWDLFTRYVYPFELTSLLLLVGVIGVLIFTRRRTTQVTQNGRNP
ncbi:MAG: NADH-quinone oxidoreductase subunit J [Armatimonadota bacterium]